MNLRCACPHQPPPPAGRQRRYWRGPALRQRLRSCACYGKSFPKGKTDAEWRRILTKEQFYVLREAGTERAFTSALDKEKRKGTFVCAGCANPLYASAHKYDSRTGWPSFWQAIDKGAVGTSTDYLIGYPAPRCTVPIAAAIWGISSMTAPSPRASGTASTASR